MYYINKVLFYCTDFVGKHAGTKHRVLQGFFSLIEALLLLKYTWVSTIVDIGIAFVLIGLVASGAIST